MAETLVHSLLQLPQRKSQQPAAIHKKNGQWQEDSWSDYYSHIETFAAFFKSLGVERDDKIAVISNTRYEWALFDFAILSVGAVTIPIYPSNTESDIEYVLNNSEAKVLVLEDDLQIEKWQSIQSKCPTVKHVLSLNEASVEAALGMNEVRQKGGQYKESHPDFFAQEVQKAKITDTATILYTSGTTGIPKGVVITHEQIKSEIEDVFQLLDIGMDDRNLAFLPASHIFGRIEIWGSMVAGWCTGYAEGIDKIKANLAEIKPTFLIAVPRIFEKIYNGVISQAEANPLRFKIFKWALNVGKKVSQHQMKREPIPLLLVPQYKIAHRLVFQKLHLALGGRLKWAASGSAPLSREIAEFFHAAGILILEGYGLTETTAGIFVNTPHDFQFGNVGKPVGDVEVKIANDGEILVKSKKVMKEYYKNPEATAEVIQDGWFHTGDIGELSEDLRLKITDRKKDLIKTAGGKYVAPQKLENLLKLNKYVSNILIHGDQKKYIVALVTLDPDTMEKYAAEEDISYAEYATLVKDEKVQKLVREAVAKANSSLASYETIKNFAILPKDFTIEDGELTPSMKVKRKVCDEKYRDVIDGLYGADRSSI